MPSLDRGTFPWRGVVLDAALLTGAAFGGTPWRYVALGVLAAEAVGYQWIAARFPIRVRDMLELAREAQETRERLDRLVESITASAADAVVVVGRYDRDEAEKLQERVGAAFRDWADE